MRERDGIYSRGGGEREREGDGRCHNLSQGCWRHSLAVERVGGKKASMGVRNEAKAAASSTSQ